MIITLCHSKVNAIEIVILFNRKREFLSKTLKEKLPLVDKINKTYTNLIEKEGPQCWIRNTSTCQDTDIWTPETFHPETEKI